MSNRKLAILAVIAAVMIVLVVVQSRLHRSEVRVWRGGGHLIQGLDTGKIAGITIGPGENAVRLVRKEGRFVVANKEDYPADISKINDLLTSCLDIITHELITTNPANFDELEVTEEKAKSVVKFLDAGQKLITGVIIGKKQPETKSWYVRLVSGNEVYSASKVPTIYDDPMDYIDKQMVNIDRSDIVKVTVAGPNETYTLTVDPNDEDKITLENLPTGKKLKEGPARSVLSALSYFSFKDVKRETSFEKDKLNFNHSYVCHLKNLMIYTFHIAKVDGKTYLKCNAEYTGDTREILKSKQNLEDKEKALLTRDEAVNFNNKHKGWVYEIAQWKADNLTKKLSDLLEEQKKQDQAEKAEGKDEVKNQQKAQAETGKEQENERTSRKPVETKPTTLQQAQPEQKPASPVPPEKQSTAGSAGVNTDANQPDQAAQAQIK